jgi:Flp pilus assembly protein TadG
MKRKRVGKLNRRGRERGIVTAVTAIALLSLIAAAGLSVDISRLYAAGIELQNAADASALAAVPELDGTADGVADAVDLAVGLINKYDFNGVKATIARENVRFAIDLVDFDKGEGLSEKEAQANPQNIRFVKVTVPPKSIGVLFAQVALGKNTVDLTRTAVAGRSIGLNRVCNIIPLSALQDPDTGAPLNVGAGCPDLTRFTPGCTYTVRLGAGDAVSPGNYLILAFGNDTGGKDLKKRLAGDAVGCVTAGEEVSTEPGITGGGVNEGINSRFGIYNSLTPDLYPPDTNVKADITYKQYLSGKPAYFEAPAYPGVTGRRLVYIPIVNYTEFDPGRDTVVIDHFGRFFLRNPIDPTDTSEPLVAEFVSSTGNCGECDYDVKGRPDSSLTTAVLYR